MSFITGLILIDAPASALNNLGQIEGERFDNSTGVKLIKTREGSYPYVSAQAVKYWLRTTLENNHSDWKSAPVYREEKIAYTDANPIEWWDDDLFGYMRAPSKKESARAKRENDESRAGETVTNETITRIAPFRMSTLVAISPVNPTSDYGVMARHEGDPVPHEHQFYRTTLKGLFSLNLKATGTFWYKKKTGFRNLDDVRIELAKKQGLEELPGEKAYRLPLDQRIQRVATIFDGMAMLDGGAKQALHYTDVSPALVIAAVTKGGNHIFGHVIGANKHGNPEFKIEAFEEALKVFKEDILSDIFVGWVRGYYDEERKKLEAFAENNNDIKILINHPRETFKAISTALRDGKNKAWMD